MSDAVRRTAVIGDVAGHLDELTGELIRLGADPVSGRLPADLTVVQVGDLVHRGPESERVVALVDRYLVDQPGQWIQLVGNHEAQYLGDPLFAWPEQLGPESVATLRRWWATGQMRAATLITAGDEDILVTHAGLTAGFWRSTLGVPVDARQTEEALNRLIGSGEGRLFQAGHLLTGRRRNQGAGPIWAVAGTELLPSWLGAPLPFSQVHGHTSLFDWQHQRYHAPAEIVRRTALDPDAKHETTTLTGGRIVGVDPGHGSRARVPWRAWEVTTG